MELEAPSALIDVEPKTIANYLVRFVLVRFRVMTTVVDSEGSIMGLLQSTAEASRVAGYLEESAALSVNTGFLNV